jgi:hypothetical protein
MPEQPVIQQVIHESFIFFHFALFSNVLISIAPNAQMILCRQTTVLGRLKAANERCLHLNTGTHAYADEISPFGYLL